MNNILTAGVSFLVWLTLLASSSHCCPSINQCASDRCVDSKLSAVNDRPRDPGHKKQSNPIYFDAVERMFLQFCVKLRNEKVIKLNKQSDPFIRHDILLTWSAVKYWSDRIFYEDYQERKKGFRFPHGNYLLHTRIIGKLLTTHPQARSDLWVDEIKSL